MCKLPMYGTILRALNCVFVDGQETASRQHAAAAVIHRCSVTTQVAASLTPSFQTRCMGVAQEQKSEGFDALAMRLPNL